MTKTNWPALRDHNEREMEILLTEQRRFAEMQVDRNVTAAQWEEVSELIMPESRNTFMYGSYNTPGVKKTDRQVDSTGMQALDKFGAILDSLLTPRNMTWHTLASLDDYVMKQRGVAQWFEQVNKLLFRYRYADMANFASQNFMGWLELGAFGTTGMFVDAFDTSTKLSYHKGLRYKQIPLGELFLTENHQGMIDGFTRWFRLTARQAVQKWGMENIPELLRGPYEMNSVTKFDFLHCVGPRSDYEPDRLDARGKPFHSFYISITGNRLLGEGGYLTFPLAASRYIQTPGEMYGRSPAMRVLPSLKTLNAQKRTFLKQAHRAADPTLLTADDGIVDRSLRPGALNAGGVNPDGKLLVHVLPTGEIQVSKEMMQEERALINDAFLVNLFQIMTETPQMSATEVIERTNEKGILLAPTVGRQNSEKLGPMVMRELDVLQQQRLLPPVPQVLREAGGEYSVVHTSPLAKAMRAQNAAGFWRTVDQVKEVIQITQDPSPMDFFNLDVAVPETADINGVLPSWMSNDDQVKAKRQARAQAQAKEQAIRAAPAQAALNSSMAKQAAAGMPQQPNPGQLPQ
jgi:hypothetical protein